MPSRNSPPAASKVVPTYSFDEDGPRLAGVPLLDRTSSGFVVPTCQSLAQRLGGIVGRVDVETLNCSLSLICNAMNSADLAKAAIAMRFLPPIEPAPVRKAGADDLKRPGWPAKTPGGLGGKFRPKTVVETTVGYAEQPDDPDATNRRTEEPKRNVERSVARRALKSILRRILAKNRLLRIIAELGGDLIPGLDAVSIAATIDDLVNAAKVFATEIKGARAAIAFVEKGPHPFKSLLVDGEHASFSSFRAFKKLEDFEKVYGEAGAGFHYHHVVEQSAVGGKVTSEMVNSTGNIIRVPELVHEQINALSASKRLAFTKGKTFRQFVHEQSFERQRELGLGALKYLDIVE